MQANCNCTKEYNKGPKKLKINKEDYDKLRTLTFLHRFFLQQLLALSIVILRPILDR